MEKRTIYIVEKYSNVYGKDDPKKEHPIDHDVDTVFQSKDVTMAEAAAKEYSKKNELDFPLRVCVRHEYRPPAEFGYSYKTDNHGWFLDDEAMPDDDVISEWWKGQKEGEEQFCGCGRELLSEQELRSEVCRDCM